VAFCDPAGGSGGDSFTLAIAHRDENNVGILDRAVEIRPPFSPDTATEQHSNATVRAARSVASDATAAKQDAQRRVDDTAATLKAAAVAVVSEHADELAVALFRARRELVRQYRILTTLAGLWGPNSTTLDGLAKMGPIKLSESAKNQRALVSAMLSASTGASEVGADPAPATEDWQTWLAALQADADAPPPGQEQSHVPRAQPLTASRAELAWRIVHQRAIRLEPASYAAGQVSVGKSPGQKQLRLLAGGFIPPTAASDEQVVKTSGHRGARVRTCAGCFVR
jgi:hypothetical protein